MTAPAIPADRDTEPCAAPADEDLCAVCGEEIVRDSDRVWLGDQPAHGWCCCVECGSCGGQGCGRCGYYGERLTHGVSVDDY